MSAQRIIPYSRQQIDEDDIAAVVRVLRSDWITQGPDITAFEKSVADYCHVPHGIAVSSATAGLHLACLALGAGAGDAVWTSPMSFVASANCARYCGADVDFVDVDADTGNMSMTALAAKLEIAKRPPKIIIPVHFAGRTCDMDALAALKERYGFAVIEDAAHALGANYADGKPVGGHPASDAVVFSFHPVKPITTGEGGMIVVKNAALAERLKLLRTHGVQRGMPAKPGWYYEQNELGYNYRITDIQAALGVSQMKKLDGFIKARRALAVRYHEKLGNLKLPLPPADSNSGWHLYAVQFDAARRDALYNQFRAQGIGVQVHYSAIHLHPYYRALGFKEGQFPVAEKFALSCLSLPLYPALSHTDQDVVVGAVEKLSPSP